MYLCLLINSYLLSNAWTLGIKDENIVGVNPLIKQVEYNCTSFDNFPKAKVPFDYKLSDSSLGKFTYDNDEDFMSTLAVKLTLKHFRNERKTLLDLPFGWHLDDKTKRYRINRFLPGPLSNYSEDQLLFIALVRVKKAVQIKQ